MRQQRPGEVRVAAIDCRMRRVRALGELLLKLGCFGVFAMREIDARLGRAIDRRDTRRTIRHVQIMHVVPHVQHGAISIVPGTGNACSHQVVDDALHGSSGVHCAQEITQRLLGPFDVLFVHRLLGGKARAAEMQTR